MLAQSLADVQGLMPLDLCSDICLGPAPSDFHVSEDDNL